MIELLVSVNKKPVDLGNGITRHSSINKLCAIDKIRMTYNGHYYAHLVNKESDAPFNSGGEWGSWVGFFKKENKHVRLPIIKIERQEVDV